jgi:L-fuculose-phosphate aldolase
MSRDSRMLRRLLVERHVLRAGRVLAAEGLVVGSTGNASARLDDGLVITPTRVRYGRMGRRDLVELDLEGRRLHGRRAPSTETPVHLAIYLGRPDVGAIVHTHSPHATAWSFLGEPLEPATEEVSYFAIGPVRTAPPAPRGTPELATAAARTLADGGAVLLGGHGVIAVGKTLDHALDVARAVEHQAQVAWLLRGRGRGPGSEPRPGPA